MAKHKNTMFTVGFFIKQWLEVEIEASTLEEAIVAGRKFTVANVLALDSQCNDSSINVITAYDQDFEI